MRRSEEKREINEKKRNSHIWLRRKTWLNVEITPTDY